MYTDFYNLKEKPFNLTPSPRFLYLGDTHKEALALLTYGLMEQKGFVLLTGEVGTGKTTIIQTFLETIDPSVHYITLFNPSLSPKDFLSYVASGLGLAADLRFKASFLIEFRTFLQKLMQHQKKVLLIVDEAQSLSLQVLEEIRLLSNMETADKKLITIFLIGQPELNQKLLHPKCLPLLQRISIRHHMHPLTLGETAAYVNTRLAVAGSSDGLFSKKAMKDIHRYSRGYPRMINILCDNALLLGYSKENRHITPAMIKECYDDLRLPESPRQEVAERHTPAASEGREPEEKRKNLRAAVLAFIFLGLLAAGLLTTPGQESVRSAWRFYGLRSSPETPTPEETTSGQFYRQSIRIHHEEPVKKGEAVAQAPSGDAGKELNVPAPNHESPKEESHNGSESLKHAVGVPGEPSRAMEKRIVTVKPGDTLMGLATHIYGYADNAIMHLLQMENPMIRDVNLIEVGQKIAFPALPFLLDRGSPLYAIPVATFQELPSAQSLSAKLNNDGFEAYIIPTLRPPKEKAFKVVIGSFANRDSAINYAKDLLRKGVVDDVEPIRIGVMGEGK